MLSTPIRRLIETHKEQSRSLKEKLGASFFVEALIQAKKPIVGYDVLQGLSLLTHQFVQPLPENFEGLRKICAVSFPRVFDVKVMLETPHIKSLVTGTKLIDVFDQI